MRDIVSGRPVYGTNTSFGGQADKVHNGGVKAKRLEAARHLSESLIFLDVGTGSRLPPEIIRCAMLIRANMLLQGVSAVRLSIVKQLVAMINARLVPVVSEYGGIGASGDLIHNERVISAARGLPHALVINERGQIERAALALKRHHLQRMMLDPKEGLALVNGDNFSTAIAAIVAIRLLRYMLISTIASAMVIEVLRGSDRSFHPLLSVVRNHPGQAEVSSMYRMLLEGSKLAHLELAGHQVRQAGMKVQDAYSLRCLPQFEGVYVDQLKQILNTITINANSVSDNPLWVPPEHVTAGETPWQWVSGGNFLAQHMVESLDSMRKITTQLVKKHDRHLARLVDCHENNGLPSNLSDERSVTQCTFKGVQIQMGMFEVHSMALANPVSTLFGTHEERNQDITSHATTSGMLALKNLDILKYSLASILLAVCQGVDLRGGGRLLSSRTRPVYTFIRSMAPYAAEDLPLGPDLEAIASSIEDGRLMDVVRKGLQ